jgi:hypothetical protein
MKDPTRPDETAGDNTAGGSRPSSGQVRQTEFQRSIEHAVSSQDTQDREAKIRRRAHELWEQEGRPEGRADTHWERAAQDLDREDADIQREGVAGERPGVQSKGDAGSAREKS